MLEVPCPTRHARRDATSRRWRDGDDGAFQELVPVVHSHLRRLARQQMADERPDHILQPTALVNEAYLRLVDTRRIKWQDRAHFFAMAARADAASARGYRARAEEPEARWRLAPGHLDQNAAGCRDTPEDLIAIDDALQALGKGYARKSHVVELRFFGGLSVEETAEVLNVSPRHRDAGLEIREGLADARAVPKPP